MIKQTCVFVEASNVFKDLPLAWNCFSESEPDCSWGDNNRTMVTPDTIIDALENADCDGCEDEVASVIERLKSLGETYVDLEN